MTDNNSKIRAVVLTALMVLSVFAGTVAFTGTAAAASPNAAASSITPSAAAEGTTNEHRVTINLTDVDTQDATNQTVSVDLSAVGANLSSTSVTDDQVVTGNVTVGSTNVDATNDVINVTLEDAGGVASDDVEVQFNITNVALPSVTSDTTAQARYALDDGDTGSFTDNGGFAYTDFQQLTVQENPQVVFGDPATVYLGDEDLDIANVGGVPDSGSHTFVGVAGEADGSTASVSNVRQADITGANNFQTGGYSADGDDDFELSVVEPRVTDLTLETENGADVTDASFSGSDTLDVTADWNFDSFEAVEVTVEDDEGLEVTGQLTADDTITTSGGTLTLTDVDELDTGEYTVTVEGADDLDGASRSATFTIRDDSQSISLGQSTATQGDNAVATVTGTPGAYGLVRIEEDDTDGLDSLDANASQVFANTGDVEGRFGTDDLAGDQDEDYVGAVVDLDDEGEAQVRIQTDALDTTTLDVEFVELDNPNTDDATLQAGFNASADDSAELTVEEQTINITSAPTVVRIGEEFTIEGTAPESDDVKVYARIDQNYVPLVDDDEDFAEDDVNSNGEFTVDVDSSSVISLPDSYRIAVVADPVDDDGTDYLEAANQDDELSSDVYGEFDTKATTSIRTVEGDLTAQVSSNNIAANVGDEVTLSGSALGQGDTIRAYLIGPRGNFLGASGSEGQVETIDIDEEEFEEDYSAFSNRGTYTFIVVGQGRDGDYAFEPNGDGSGLIESDLTPQQAVAIVNDEYTGAGVDDQIIEITVQAENPQLSINDFTTNGQVDQGEVTISGTSNREDGTVVFIEVLGENENVIASDEAEVNGTTNEWSTTVDMTDVETGTYTLRADDDEASASLEFELVTTLNTPTETPSEDTDTATPEPDTATPEPDTATDDATPTTSSQTPGFGVVVALVALVALLAAALLAFRRD